MVSLSGEKILRQKQEFKKFNGFIMNKDVKTVKVKDGEIEKILHETAPLYIRTGGSFKGWLDTRIIDTHRANSRKLRKRLSLKTIDDSNIVLKFHSITMTDNYWTLELEGDLTFEDVSKVSDELANTALNGEIDYDENKDFSSIITPEITNIGSFEKCWKVIRNKWYLIKKGNSNENFSEVFAYRLGKLLNFDVIEYKLYEGNENYVMCENFTQNKKYNFEPMSVLVESDEDEELTFEYLKKLNINAKKYFDMLFLDGLIFNSDRHTNNYGLLLDSDTGEVFDFAPNFDNNLALLGYQALGDYKSQIGHCKYIFDFLKAHNYKKPQLEADKLEEIINDTYKEFKNLSKTKEYIYNFIMYRYNLY